MAQDKRYFEAERLEYEFRDNWGEGDIAKKHATPNKSGAYQSFEKGRPVDVSCACHWTVNVAASAGHGKLYADAYSVSPCAIFVPPESPVRQPADLKGVPISVGFQSGSHYATIQALEQYMPQEEIALSFADGLLFSRMQLLLIDRKVPAASLFSGPYYFLEQLGFRKIIDSTFMIASMITGTPDMEDVRKYFRALRRAQRDIDLRPELYTHFYRKEFRRDSWMKWTRAASGRASASCSSRIPARCSNKRPGGSPSTRSFPKAGWAPAGTRSR